MKMNELLASAWIFIHSGFHNDVLYRRSPFTMAKTLNYTKRKNISTDNEAQILMNANVTKITKLIQKIVYLELVSQLVSIPTAQKRFSEMYPDYNFQWDQLYKIPFKITIDSRLRLFQYKYFTVYYIQKITVQNEDNRHM